MRAKTLEHFSPNPSDAKEIFDTPKAAEALA